MREEKEKKERKKQREEEDIYLPWDNLNNNRDTKQGKKNNLRKGGNPRNETIFMDDDT